jgi:hypothetical protein
MTSPAPLTPADCNLQDFPFMPLDVARLRDSDMAAYVSPEACWAAVLLWSAAWHQVPAASLPDDDRFLAKAAGYGRVVKEWLNVREGALHGWVKCADGRLYHPVVAEKANESWHKKLHHAWKKECDRIRKANKQREAEGKPLLPFPPEPTPPSAAVPAETNEIPAETPQHSDGRDDEGAGIPLENALKGEGEGQGEGQGQGEFKTTTTNAHAGDNFDAPRAAPLPASTELEQDENQPAIALAVKLRTWKVNATFTRPEVQDWVRDKVSLDILQEAIAVARQHKGDAIIDPAYLVPIVNRLLNPRPRSRSGGDAPAAAPLRAGVDYE